MSRLLTDMASTPLAAPALALAGGIVCGRYIDIDWVPLTFGAIAIVGCALYLAPYLFRNREKRLLASYRRRNLIWLITLPLVAMFGFMLIRFKSPQTNALPELPFVKATVLERNTTTHGDRFIVLASAFISDTGRSENIRPVKMLVYANATDVQPGDIILFRANPEPIALTSESSEFHYSRSIDYSSSATDKFIKVIGKDNSLRFKALNIRDRIVSLIDDSSLSPSAKALVTAMLAGDRDALQPETKDEFATAGLAHILALSGLHVGIIVLLLGWILYPLNLTGHRSTRYLLLCAGVITFAFITGLSPSVTRAAIMCVCLLGAMILQRRNANINALALAAIIILAFDPRALFDAGFQLSFLCTLAIICIAPIFRTAGRPTLKGKLIMAAAVPCCIFIVTWPLTAWHFHNVPLLFLPLNLIAVPLLPTFMTCAVIYTLLLAFGIDAGWLCHLIDWMCDALTFATKAIASLDFASVQLFPHWLVPATAILTFGIISYWLRVRSRPALWLSLWSVTMLIAAIIIMPPVTPADKIKIPALYDRTEIEYTLHGNTDKVTLRDGAVTHIGINGITILYADKDLQMHSAEGCHSTDILVFGPNFRGEADSLITRCNPQLIIISPRLRERQTEYISSVCANASLPLHDLSSSPFILLIK